MTIRSYAVIGAGLVGAACAFRLRQAGFDVILIDPGDMRRGASFGNIGHIAAEQTEPLASPALLRSFIGRLYAFGGPVDFRWRDAPLLAPWIARFLAAATPARFESGCAALSALMYDTLAAWTRLGAALNQPDLIAPNGHAVVWMTPDAARTGRTAWARTATGDASLREMETEEIAAYRDVLRAPPAGGLMFSGTGQVRSPQAVRAALLEAFAALGGQNVRATASGLTLRTHGVSIALAEGGVVEADAALIAAGAWSAPLLASVGVRAPLIGERGYSVQSARHQWPSTLPPTVFEDRALVLTRFSDGLRASSFVEFGDPDAPGDPRKWRTIERAVRDLGVAFDETPDRWVGPRPTLPDYLPAIGRLQRAPRVLYAFGHQHLGLTLAARTGELIADLAQDKPTSIDLAPFQIERFA